MEFTLAEMGETGMDCRSLEENIYWNHFHYIHFSQFLRAGSDLQFEIPEKFAKNLKKKIPENVTLRGPSGVVWNVGLSTTDDTMMFKNGWGQFVKDQSLKENDFLIFKYNGESHFDVLIFDGCSMCEKETSYFVRECGNSKQVSDTQTTKRKVGESSVEIVHTSSEDEEFDCIPVTEVIDNGVSVAKGRRTSARRFVKRIQSEAATKATTKECNGPANGDEQTPISRNIGHEVYYVSNRRPITEDEKAKALELAEAASTDDSFIAIMRPSAVYKRFYLAFSKVWIGKHLPLHNHDVILTYKGNKWHTRFYYFKATRSGGLNSGWKNFALENHLDTYDVCLFEPTNKSNDFIELDVSIFRVVPEVIPLTRVNQSSPVPPMPLPSQCRQSESPPI